MAAAAPCACGGRWVANVVGSFVANGIDVSELCHDILKAFTDGRSETTPVVALGGRLGGEGKSIFLKALFNVFPVDGAVFARPEKGNFPLLGLEEAKVAFLDEWRFDPSVLTYATQCLWFDGSALPISKPENVSGSAGHSLYKGSAPIFITTKLPDIEWLESAAAVDPHTGLPWDADASMLLRRLKVYRFTNRIAKPDASLPQCAHCFANLVLQQAAVWTKAGCRWAIAQRQSLARATREIRACN